MTQAQRVTTILLFGDRITPNVIDTILLYNKDVGLSLKESWAETRLEFRRRGWAMPNWIFESDFIKELEAGRIV